MKCLFLILILFIICKLLKKNNTTPRSNFGSSTIRKIFINNKTGQDIIAINGFSTTSPFLNGDEIKNKRIQTIIPNNKTVKFDCIVDVTDSNKLKRLWEKKRINFYTQLYTQLGVLVNYQGFYSFMEKDRSIQNNDTVIVTLDKKGPLLGYPKNTYELFYKFSLSRNNKIINFNEITWKTKTD
jgi:hypothetical protein